MQAPPTDPRTMPAIRMKAQKKNNNFPSITTSIFWNPFCSKGTGEGGKNKKNCKMFLALVQHIASQESPTHQKEEQSGKGETFAHTALRFVLFEIVGTIKNEKKEYRIHTNYRP